jgi:hypothetical protein
MSSVLSFHFSQYVADVKFDRSFRDHERACRLAGSFSFPDAKEHFHLAYGQLVDSNIGILHGTAPSQQQLRLGCFKTTLV